MKAAFPAIWAESPSSLRREPTNTELAGGLPCGPFDKKLLDELFYRVSLMNEELENALLANGITPSAGVYDQLAAAIKGRAIAQVGRGASVTQTAAQLIPTGVETALTWPTPLLDTDAVWNPAQPTRIKIPAGTTKLRVNCQVTFEAEGTGSRKFRVLIDGLYEGFGFPASRALAAGSADVTVLPGSGGIVDITRMPTPLIPDGSNYIQFMVTHDRGSGLNTRVNNTWMTAEWLN